MGMVADYGDEHIRTLDWKEHIRRRPGMYIGKLGDGTSADDGIYILIKEVLDNSVDEYMMGFGKCIDITIADDKTVTVRDYGRGVPLGKLVDVASKMNTGAKYDSKAFKKSVGLNGVGIKAVNALSDAFLIRSVRDGEARSVRFEKGNEIADVSESGVGEKNGTMVSFHADESVFGSYDFHMEYVESMVRNYTYLNAGLTIKVNGQAFVSGCSTCCRKTSAKSRSTRPFTSAERTSKWSSRTGTATAKPTTRSSTVSIRRRAERTRPLSAKGSPRRSRNFTKRTTMRQTSARR